MNLSRGRRQEGRHDDRCHRAQSHSARTADMNPMTTSLREDIDWVGCVDWTVRDFHGYDATRGSTYNAYLVRDERTALMDAVRAPFAESCWPTSRPCATRRRSALRRLQSCRARPFRRAAAGDAGPPRATLVCDARCRAALAAALRHVGLEDPGGRRRADDLAGPADAPLPRHAHGPLARVDVHLRARGASCCSRWTSSASTTPRRSGSTTRCPPDVLMDEAKTYYANILMPYGGGRGRLPGEAGRRWTST